MVEVTVVYWRDIPAQVIAGRGRKAAKIPLPERFEQAIDRAAMKTGAAGTDAYLAQWQKVSLGDVAGDAQAVAESEAARIEREYDQDRVKSLVDNGGHASTETS